MSRLSDRQVKAMRPKEKDYVVSDGGGLQLRVRANGSRLWNFNYYHPVTKKRINLGLGPYPEVSLAEARKQAMEARELVAQGVDPKQSRDQGQETLRETHEQTLKAVTECQWPLILTHLWPIKLTHPCSFNPQFFASVDSFHLPA